MQNKIKLSKKQIDNFYFFVIVLNLFFIGICFNFMAVINNEGKMPVLFNKYEFDYPRHFSFSDCNKVKYCYLTDIFTILEYHFSVGDFLIATSLIIEIVILIKIVSIKFSLNLQKNITSKINKYWVLNCLFFNVFE